MFLRISKFILILIFSPVMLFAYQIKSCQYNNDRCTVLNKMKLFQNDQEFYKILDIFPNKSNQRCTFTVKNLFIIIGLILLLSSSIAFFLFKAKSAEERAYSFFVSMSVLTCLFQLLVVFWKFPNMLKFIAKFEKFIEKRKL